MPGPEARPLPAIEQELLDRAAAGEAACAVWEPPCSLVVPASYRRFDRFEPACADFASQGWPVAVRRSGGGLVPQGPGVLDLSIAWRTRTAMGDAMEPVYAALCTLLQQAIAPLGIATAWQAVEGSFCDGRFNLARSGRKVAGTAQYWKRIGPAEHVVLAHACLLVDTDLAGLNARANDFEAALGTGRFYRSDAIANLADATAASPARPGGRRVDMPALAEVLLQAARARGALC